MHYFTGLDIGSLSCDGVIIDENGVVRAHSVVPTGAKNKEAIDRCLKEMLERCPDAHDRIKATVSTGYGRDRVEGRLTAVTEITCHARGIEAVHPNTQVLIDIGGQDSKAILIGTNGKVLDFAMNDKCAAGTGRFLEAMARALQVDIEELAELDHGATANLTLSSMCTVFAESEVVSLIAEGREINEIVAGLNRAIAMRTIGLVKRIVSDPRGKVIAMSGGVARNGGVVRALGKGFGVDIFTPDSPDTIGALGAALIARERSVTV